MFIPGTQIDLPENLIHSASLYCPLCGNAPFENNVLMYYYFCEEKIIKVYCAAWTCCGHIFEKKWAADYFEEHVIRRT